jgi:molybdenum cofactor cytidylyltransferase
MIFAIVPAAGKSTRMGRPKLALPLGPRTVLEHVVLAVRRAGVEQVLVVVGPDDQLLEPLEGLAGAQVLRLEAETGEMRATVEHGLRWIEDHCHPQPEDDWLLIPADHPALESAIIRQLIQARNEDPNASVFVPTYQGRRGHPALLRWKHVRDIKLLEPGIGLNVYLRRQTAKTKEVSVQSPLVLWDLDTPEDYERMKTLVHHFV